MHEKLLAFVVRPATSCARDVMDRSPSVPNAWPTAPPASERASERERARERAHSAPAASAAPAEAAVSQSVIGTPCRHRPHAARGPLLKAILIIVHDDSYASSARQTRELDICMHAALRPRRSSSLPPSTQRLHRGSKRRRALRRSLLHLARRGRRNWAAGPWMLRGGSSAAAIAALPPTRPACERNIVLWATSQWEWR